MRRQLALTEHVILGPEGKEAVGSAPGAPFIRFITQEPSREAAGEGYARRGGEKQC